MKQQLNFAQQKFLLGQLPDPQQRVVLPAEPDGGDDVRITEIAITDITGQILAIGKSDRQIIKPKNDFVVFDVQIVV